MEMLRHLAFYKPDSRPWTRADVEHIGRVCNADSATNVDSGVKYVYDNSSSDTGAISMCNWSVQNTIAIRKCTEIAYDTALTRDELLVLLGKKEKQSNFNIFKIKDYQ